MTNTTPSTKTMNPSKYLEETLSFPNLAKNLLLETGWDREEFLKKTELSNNIYYQIRSGAERTYDKRIVMTLIIAFQLGPVWGETLFHLAGYTFSPFNPVDLAYADILANEACCDTTTANRRLTDFGISTKYHLGSTPY